MIIRKRISEFDPNLSYVPSPPKILVPRKEFSVTLLELSFPLYFSSWTE